MPVRPGTLNKHVPNSSIASLRYRASSYGLPRGSLARNETEIAHQLAWAFKAGHVTDFRGKGDGDNQIDPAQRLQRSNNRAERPVRNEFLNHFLQSFDTLLRDANCLDHFLQCYLMCRMIEPLLLQPVQIPHRPAFLARIDAPVLEHEGTYLLPMNPQRLDSGRAGANEISHSFVTLVGNPDRRELAGPQ